MICVKAEKGFLDRMENSKIISANESHFHSGTLFHMMLDYTSILEENNIRKRTLL